MKYLDIIGKSIGFEIGDRAIIVITDIHFYANIVFHKFN